ncbi:13046_t:CDS:2, partial [Ambispora leptoticha]
IAERLLKLSTTSLAIWLLMFYALFHSFLNALAEVLRFGDRTFYLAWWNSGSLATYWRLWNRPVYQWFKRHVYAPLVDNGMSPRMASLVVFTLSAAFHEFLIGIPTHSLMGFAFLGMMTQIPLIEITKPLEKWRGKGTAFGNVIFWMSFCLVGQPAATLLYYYQWNMTHQI